MTFGCQCQTIRPHCHRQLSQDSWSNILGTKKWSISVWCHTWTVIGALATTTIFRICCSRSRMNSVIDFRIIYDGQWNPLGNRLWFFWWPITRNGSEYLWMQCNWLKWNYRIIHIYRRFYAPENFANDLYYLIVFTQTNVRPSNAELDEIFVDCYQKTLLNANILFPYSNESMMMTTYIPFERDCMRLTRRDLGILSECELELSDSFDEVFPKKGLNMNECTLVVAIFPSEPLVIIRSINESTNDADAEGVEVELLLQMAKVLNFTLRFKVPADKQKRGVINRNGSSSGCFGMVNRPLVIIFPSTKWSKFHLHILVDDGRGQPHCRHIRVYFPEKPILHPVLSVYAAPVGVLHSTGQWHSIANLQTAGAVRLFRLAVAWSVSARRDFNHPAFEGTWSGSTAFYYRRPNESDANL